jgi:hypothetical protein
MKKLNLVKHFVFLPFKLLTVFILLILIVVKQIFINPRHVTVIPQKLINFLMINLLKK